MWLPLAARISGVTSAPFFAFTSAPSASRRATHCLSPATAALYNGVSWATTITGNPMTARATSDTPKALRYHLCEDMG